MDKYNLSDVDCSESSRGYQGINFANENRDSLMRFQIEYYKALLRQDVGFYDENEAAVLSQKVTEDVKKIQDALGEKFSTTVKCLGTFLGGISLGLGKLSSQIEKETFKKGPLLN